MLSCSKTYGKHIGVARAVGIGNPEAIKYWGPTFAMSRNSDQNFYVIHTTLA